MPAPTAPVLVRSAESARRAATWGDAGRRALEHSFGSLRVLGGPGTGKSTLTAELAADRIRNRGVSPENVLVLTGSRRAASWMRTEVTRLLAGSAGLRTSPEPLVRTVHSYAFAVLRLQAVRDELPPPQLLAGPDQDALVRELLEGDLDLGAPGWPETLRPALSVPGFAEELRDLLLRATERGVGPERLVELGREHGLPEWIAAGRFARQYEQVTLLRGAGGSQAPAVDAAELIATALLAFDSDPGLLAAEQDRVRYVLLDDAQHLDPLQLRLVRKLADTATEFVMTGDPDQAIYTFRGADPRGFLDADPDGAGSDGADVVVLSTDHRMSKPVREAVRRLATRLPGHGPQRHLIEPADGRDGAVRVRLLATEAQEAAWVADQLRRAHLLEEVPWSRMAVVVRSTGRSLPVLRRALLAAGVPITLPVDDQPLAARTAVRPLLTLLRCAARPDQLDGSAAEELLNSQLGGADPLALRRLKRGLLRLDTATGGGRASSELLVEVLRSGDKLAALEESAAEPARRIAKLLESARDSIDKGQTVEETLWRVWKSTGLEKRWITQSERHGVTGMQADRHLDAIVALFDAAANYVDKNPGNDAYGFVAELDGQQIAGSSLAPTAPRDNAVQILTAHAASGQEWDVVAIPGVQEGSWPDLRLRGSLLGVERLVDVLSGMSAERVSATAPLLAEERRLLLVAASRARRDLLVSAVRGEDEQPSRFLDELDGVESDPDSAERPVERPERGLTLADLVGELRQVVCDPEEDAERKRRAAHQLARLAADGVPGADPDSWYGLPESSSGAPLITGDEPVRVSPSTVDVLAKCPLRWLIERNGGQDTAELAAVTGTLVHALVQAAADGADTERLHAELDKAWEQVDAGAPWFSRKERKRVEGMLDAFIHWLVQSRAELTQLGVERDLDVGVPGKEGGPWLRLRGRVDRLEADGDGRPVVVDVKTAKVPVSKNEAAEHPQLAVYQLAAALGAFGEEGEAGGARLLYVAKSDRTGAATERTQEAFDQESFQLWLDVVQQAAADSLGPGYTARENTDCSRCPARTSCPVHPAGRQVSQ